MSDKAREFLNGLWPYMAPTDGAVAIQIAAEEELDRMLDAAREEAARIADGWLEEFSDKPIKYVSPAKYACDAVRDLRDAIRALKSSTPTQG